MRTAHWQIFFSHEYELYIMRVLIAGRSRIYTTFLRARGGCLIIHRVRLDYVCLLAVLRLIRSDQKECDSPGSSASHLALRLVVIFIIRPTKV